MKISMEFDNINEFIDALDCLFALGKIQYNEEREELINVI